MDFFHNHLDLEKTLCIHILRHCTNLYSPTLHTFAILVKYNFYGPTLHTFATLVKYNLIYIIHKMRS